MKVVLLSKENMKKKPKSAQKIHFLFTIIAAKTVKTHKKIEKHTKKQWKTTCNDTTLWGKMVVFYCETGQVKYIIESSNK